MNRSITVHTMIYKNGPLKIPVNNIVGQIKPWVNLDDDGLFKSLINTISGSYKVTETKEEILSLIEEAKKDD